jgi:branched-chain amino acid transport system ATP-binding protein
MNMLDVEALHVAYGGIRAIKGISFSVKRGELVSLLGANGAGKTTTLKALTALHPRLSGRISFQNNAIYGLGAWDLAKRGLVMVPEGRGSFTRMTILENLQMGAYLRDDQDVDIDIEKVFALFPRLKERRKQLAGTMSGGEQQMLAMGRALMARPQLLLLDEPSMGLSPIMVDTIFEVIRNIHQNGMTILLVEQNAARALQVADRAYVIESGEIIMQGEASMMLNDPRVRASYLGE